MRVDAPGLRIITDDQWEAAVRRFESTRRMYSAGNPKGGGRPAGSGVKHLLAGLLQCETCGSTLEARSRRHGGRRVVFYGCGGYHRRGRSVCSNSLAIPAALVHDAVLARLRSVIFDPQAMEVILREAEARWEEHQRQGVQTRSAESLLARRTELHAELSRLAEAIAKGADVDAVLDGVRQRQAELVKVQEALTRLAPVKPLQPLDDNVRQRLRDRSNDWQAVLERSPAEGNALLRTVLAGKISFGPREDEQGPYYQFLGRATIGTVLAGFVPHTVMFPKELANSMGLDVPQNLASPTGFEPVF